MPIKSEKSYKELIDNYYKSPESYGFFVGAGMSQPLFPSWKSLLLSLIDLSKECDLPGTKEELINYVEKGEKFLEVAETCISGMNGPKYRDFLEESFDKEFCTEDIPDNYRLLFDLSPSVILTTNYDRIPQIAGHGKYREYSNSTASEAMRALVDKKRFVFKMHGSISDHSSIVLKESDYDRIIYSSEPTKQFLRNLLSTRKFIFLGFSLSDPHLALIFKYLNSLHNEIPLSHYILLNEPSDFVVTSFERSFGVNIIQYTPLDHSHPEIAEFLRILSKDTSEIIEEPEEVFSEFSDTKALLSNVKTSLEDVLINSEISVFVENGILSVSFSPSGQTRSEIQKEILSILRIMTFDTELVSQLFISTYHKTKPSLNVDQTYPLGITLKTQYQNAKMYARRKISTSTVWKNSSFLSPKSLTNILVSESNVEYPISVGIVGDI